MNFLEYLYSKYYYFQERVGNADIAPFSAMMIILLIFITYYFVLFFLTILFIPKGVLNIEYFKYLSLFLLLYFFIQSYFLLFYKRRYKKILKRNDSKKKSNLGAILFPLIAFVLLILTMFLKVLQNNGEL
jgi:hypothetical protein